MGLFSRKKTAQRVEISELIFCPYRNKEEILSVLEQAFHIEGSGTGDQLTLSNGDMSIAFLVYSADGEEESYARDQIQGVWNYFRQVDTEHLEIQRNILHHLRMCRGVVSVFAAYDGPQNPEKEENIMCQIHQAAIQLQGILTKGMDTLCDSGGRPIFDKKGHSDLDFYMPPKYPLPEDWVENAPLDEYSRRERSLDHLEERHIYAPSFLPLLGASEHTQGRSLLEISKRAAALLAVAVYSECRLGEKMSYDEARAFIKPMIEAFGAEDSFSQNELNYLINPSSTQQEQIQFVWQYEALWVMEWALGLNDELYWPDHICDVAKSVRLMHKPDMDALISEAKPRDRCEILDMADLYYLLHWASVDARISDLPAPQGLDEGVVMERRRALFWLAGCDDLCPWDDVDLST